MQLTFSSASSAGHCRLYVIRRVSDRSLQSRPGRFLEPALGHCFANGGLDVAYNLYFGNSFAHAVWGAEFGHKVFFCLRSTIENGSRESGRWTHNGRRFEKNDRCVSVTATLCHCDNNAVGAILFADFVRLAPGIIKGLYTLWCVLSATSLSHFFNEFLGWSSCPGGHHHHIFSSSDSSSRINSLCTRHEPPSHLSRVSAASACYQIRQNLTTTIQ